MSRLTQTVTLVSDRHFGRRLPLRAIGAVLTALPKVVRQAVSMAFLGHSDDNSGKQGWLEDAADLRFTDHQGDDESILVFELPTLGEAAADLFESGEPWSTSLDPNATGLDLLGDVVREIASRNIESERFDRRLLGRIARLKTLFDGAFRELRLNPRHSGESPVTVINPQLALSAKRLRDATPHPQRVRVVGLLEAVHPTTRSFLLRLDDGQEDRGILASGSIPDALAHLNRRVLVLGTAVYRASGRLLRIDADAIRAGDGEPALWSRIPPPRTQGIDSSVLHVPQSPGTGVSAIIGRWPGDETDEEIAAWLERNS